MKILALLALLAIGASPPPAAGADLTLTGSLTRADHETYRTLRFQVPPGVARLTVTLAYTGRNEHATIDMGLFDPAGFRGWSGGNKANFTLAATDATPSYLAGPIRPGAWRLVLGVPNLRRGARADYAVSITYGHGEPPAVSAFSEKPLRDAPAWYRGDLHLHTAHSDGVCPSQGGAIVPCPVFKTLEAAAARGLDFVVVSDHNTVAQDQDLRELQPWFDRLLLIGGEEVTTFHGHAGVIGAAGFVDFRLGSQAVPTVSALLAGAARTHALVVINHPALPSGEACMGCGWTAVDTDYSAVQGVEVVNGGALAFQGGLVAGPLSGIPFWEGRLNAGHRLTAVGGSDNHRPDTPADRPSAIGYPTTVVHADNLSERAVLAAIRAGHVFIDVEGSRDRVLEMTATAGGASAAMGEVLSCAACMARFVVHAAGVAGAQWRVIEDGHRLNKLDNVSIATSDQTATFETVIERGLHWVRVEIRSVDDRRTLLIGNPIYFNLPVVKRS